MPTCCSARSRSWCSPSISDGATHVGVGCGGPMDEGGEHVSPLNIPAWRDVPVARRGSPRTPACRCASTTTRRRSRSAKAGSARPRASATTSRMVVSTGVGGGIVLDGRLLDGADGNAGPHRPRHRRARRPASAAAVRAAASKPRRRAPRSRASPGGRRPRHRAAGRRAHRHARRPRGRVGREPARPRRSRSSRVRSRSASARRSSRPRKPRSTRAAASTSRAGTRIVPGALGADGPLIGAAARRTRALH